MFLQTINDIKVKALFYATAILTQKHDIMINMQIFCRQSIMD